MRPSLLGSTLCLLLLACTPMAAEPGDEPGGSGGAPAGTGGAPAGTGGSAPATGGAPGGGGIPSNACTPGGPNVTPTGTGGTPTGTGGTPGSGGARTDAATSSGSDTTPATPSMATDPGSEGDGNTTKMGPYNPPPEATLAAGVTAGKLLDVMVDAKVFAGRSRVVKVYIPNGYVEMTPVPFIVLQDGPSYINNFKMPIVLDNMIAKKQLPVQLAIFVPNAGGSRSLEYDTLSDAYTRFVLEDVLPAVEKALPVKLTTDPEGRAAGGHSSGGICAFTMGWSRPDQFRRILSHSGSFVSLRGGDKYPGIVKAAETKPLRVFMSVGSADNENGRWLRGNEALAAALKEKSYHYRYVLLNGGTHAQGSPASILPESLLWLWRGYPIAK